MKKIGFISKNKMFAQSLASLILKLPDLGFEPYLLLNFHQAVLDAEVLNIDVVVFDMIAGFPKQTEMAIQICENLRRTVPDCRVLLLVPQDDMETRDIAMKAVRNKTADDYVFYDASLDYLLAKLLAL